MTSRRTDVVKKNEGEVDRVYRLLKNWILQCEFRPGDFLTEVSLAERCETSRTPIREACNRLSQEGWISGIRHKGYVVPSISARDIVEIYEYRKLLECFNAEKAAQTRHKFYDMAAAEKATVVGFHFPFPAVGHVEKDGNGYRLIPVAFNPVL